MTHPYPPNTIAHGHALELARRLADGSELAEDRATVQVEMF